MLKVFFMRFIMGAIIKFSWRKKKPRNLSVNTEEIPVEGGKIRAHIYTPQGEGPFPLLVYFHGGGFVIGDIDCYDGMCRDLCVQANSIVVSVDYRLAPEHPFPTAANDSFEALQWAVENRERLNGKKDSLFVAGDSAGGNLAAVSTWQARDKLPGVVKGQILIYPVTTHYSAELESYEENAKGQGLTRGMMIWFWDTYLKDSPLLLPGETQHDLATPLQIEDLSGLPDALVITAEKDPLRDEGNLYAEALRKQGVQVQHTQYPKLQHGFIGVSGPTSGHHKGMLEIAAWIDQRA